MTKKIIAFSLWGTIPKYTKGAIKNAELAHKIYPGWTCRFYVGNDVEDSIINHLKDRGGECVMMDGTGWNGMFWRFLAADGDDVTISRDTDSRLGLREKAAVDAWLASDKDFHIMRDHPYHATEILGGMWGARNGLLKGISKWIEEYNTRDFDDKYQVDQNFLREVVYDKVVDNSIVHDEFFGGLDFPKEGARRTPGDFVGQVYDENDNPEF